MQPKIITHGGATSKGPHDKQKQKAAVRAAEAAYALLQAGKSALDAVEHAVNMMEDFPYLNAGTGSFLQMDGNVRMDASIMDGSTLRAGAVIDIENVKNPVSVARKVMDETEHVILAAQAAHAFAHAMKFEDYDPRTEEKIKVWEELHRETGHLPPFECLKKLDKMIKTHATLGTVGCVALDRKGHLAAATSTGGLRIDLPGRVGDTPIIGGGTYANKHAAVSCTGIGEKIIKAVLAHRVVHHVEVGWNAAKSAKEGLSFLSSKLDGRGGLVCLDAKGETAAVYDTEVMFHHIIEQ